MPDENAEASLRAARILSHPGPRLEPRAITVPCAVRRIEIALQPGLSVNDSVAQALERHGASSAYVRLDGVVLEPLRYVMPAHAPTPDHAVYFSDTFAPEGPAETLSAGMSVGLRDGAPFSHCHGLWRMADAPAIMGHLLVLEAIVQKPAQVSAWAISGARMEARDDGETNFRLFTPEAATAEPVGQRALLCRIRPNENFIATVERLCRAHGFANAELHGIGSLVGGQVRGAAPMTSIVTEVLILNGAIEDDRLEIDMAIVGTKAEIVSGRLEPSNLVGVTFELLIVARVTP